MLYEKLDCRFAGQNLQLIKQHGELTLELSSDTLIEVGYALRDEPDFRFSMLVDLCGVDYLHYGLSEWETTAASGRGFERGVDESEFRKAVRSDARYAVVIHLLSIELNQRLRLRVWLDEATPVLPSVMEIWPAASWFEREAFDLFGIVFTGHPDLRRILTDYGFIGHPFRKDFPLSGHVEVRYDAARQQVIYEPVEIEPRILEPKVIRDRPEDVREYS